MLTQHDTYLVFLATVTAIVAGSQLNQWINAVRMRLEVRRFMEKYDIEELERRAKEDKENQ